MLSSSHTRGFSSSPLPSHCAAVSLSGYSASPASLSSVRLARVAVPSALLPREVLLRVLAVSVNPLDVLAACGYGQSVLSLSADGQYGLGRDAVGVVERVGSAVWRHREGDTLWVSRDTLAGGTFAQYIAVDGRTQRTRHCPRRRSTQPRDTHCSTLCALALPLCCVLVSVRECGVAPRSLPAAVAACYPFVASTLWAALVGTAGLRPRSLQQWRLHAEAASGGDGDSGGIVGRALVHGAAGPLGLLACQLLRAWGYSVTGTCRPAQDDTQLARAAQYTVRTEAEGERIDPAAPPSWLSRVPGLGSYSLFLDCVGGTGSELAALSALQSPGGHFVSLRGSLLPLLDAGGLLRGGVRSAARLLERKAVFGARGLRYDWAVNRCSRDALHYVSAAIEHGLLQTTQPAQILRGIESVPAAMERHTTQTATGKVVVEL